MTGGAGGGGIEVGRPPIRHVLLDADGVLQQVPGGWRAAFEPFLGSRTEAFMDDVFVAERPSLAGDGTFLPTLAAALARHGATSSAEEVHAAAWCRIEVDPASHGLAQTLRRAGYGVHLGTNQQPERAAYMRRELGYDALFDVGCYSCELGVAKPDPRFFERAALRIGADVGAVLFVDDRQDNVEAARAAGMPAERWTIDDGHELLVGLLAGHGVDAATR